MGETQKFKSCNLIFLFLGDKSLGETNVIMNMSEYTIPRRRIEKIPLTLGGDFFTSGSSLQSTIEGGTEHGGEYCFRGAPSVENVPGAYFLMGWPYSYVDNVRILFPALCKCNHV